MCENYSDSIGIWQLAPSLGSFSSTCLNVYFIIGHWQQMGEVDMGVLKILSLLSLGVAFLLTAITGFVFTDNVIHSKKLRILFIVMAQFDLVKLYIFLYQRF